MLSLSYPITRAIIPNGSHRGKSVRNAYIPNKNIITMFTGVQHEPVKKNSAKATNTSFKIEKSYSSSKL